jgi:hypothetical protein
MIKRLAPALRKKIKKAPLRSKNKKSRRVATRAVSSRARGEDDSTLAAEQIFLMYDAAEAKHGKA